jgi:hypothetical protein
MTKGNWERRAEMSLIRRTEAKEKKASKSDTTKINLESILQKLQRDEQLILSGGNVNVWLKDPTENLLCKCYMRRDDCRNKKCKLIHDGVNIGHLRNVPYTASTETPPVQETEKACLPPVPISEVAAKESSRIMFIAVDGACIFDYLNPELWHKWIAAHNPVCPTDSDILRSPSLGDKARKSAAKGVSPLLPTLEETDNDDDAQNIGATSEEDSEEENILKTKTETPKKVSSSSSSSNRIFFKSDAEAKSMSAVFTFLSNDDVISVLCCGKASKSICLKDEGVRQRKKEAIAAFAHDASKKKKEEKRKKAKNACISKVDKKDAFARGATIR